MTTTLTPMAAMPMLQLGTRTTVRAAELVDVPAVVRMIAAPTPSDDWEQTQSAMRLVLAHYALEEGRIWVAERAEGGLLAAAVWLPPGVGAEPPTPASAASSPANSPPAHRTCRSCRCG